MDDIVREALDAFAAAHESDNRAAALDDLRFARLGGEWQVGLGLVNGYDALANGNYGPIEAQAASFPTRFLPGGRVLQETLKTVRGPTGIIRNASGRFRSSILNNEAVEKAGQAAFERVAGAMSGAVFDRQKP